MRSLADSHGWGVLEALRCSSSLDSSVATNVFVPYAVVPGYLLISWIRVLPSVWFLVLWYATRLIFDAPRPDFAAAKIGKVQENNEDSKSTATGQLSR